jgi:6-phosphogluconate dehydrogenase
MRNKYGTHERICNQFLGPRSIIILVKAGSPVDQTIAALSSHMDPGNAIINNGKEWYENTKR